MAINRIEGGFSQLIKYARVVRKDPELAGRLADEQRRLDAIFSEAGLGNVSDPAGEINRERSQRSGEKEERLSKHMAVLAKEALRVEDGHFVHHTRVSVVRFLQSNQVPGFQPGYDDRTVSAQIGRLAMKVYRLTIRAKGGPISEIVEVRGRDLSSSWLKFFRYAAEIFPSETTRLHLCEMFLAYPRLTRDFTPREALEATERHLGRPLGSRF